MANDAGPVGRKVNIFDIDFSGGICDGLLKFADQIERRGDKKFAPFIRKIAPILQEANDAGVSLVLQFVADPQQREDGVLAGAPVISLSSTDHAAELARMSASVAGVIQRVADDYRAECDREQAKKN